MDQFLERCGKHELVTSVWAVESDFLDYDSLFQKIYNPVTKGIVKWQIFSCEKNVINDGNQAQTLLVYFKTSNLPDAKQTSMNIISLKELSRNLILLAEPLALTPPKIKAIKQVELFTRYRELLPLEWYDITCPDPGKEIILGIKGQRNQKAKEYAAAKNKS
jgi:hypothetical protein